MFKNRRMISFQPGDSFIHSLSGASKFVFFVLASLSAMLSYDTRFLVLLALVSLTLLKVSGIRLCNVSFVFLFTIGFAILNVVTIYLFAPQYGVEIYGAKTVLMSLGSYSLTVQELFYLFNLVVKYFCTVPLAIIFLVTTHPSQFASSLNQIGISYKIAYAVSLTLRYIPDLQEEFYMIKMSQEARGLELSKNDKLIEKIKGNLKIVVPLIFSSLERIDRVSIAMELRRFGKYKTRTWYSYQKFGQLDLFIVTSAFFLLLTSIGLFITNQGRFYNPWKLVC